MIIRPLCLATSATLCSLVLRCCGASRGQPGNFIDGGPVCLKQLSLPVYHVPAYLSTRLEVHPCMPIHVYTCPLDCSALSTSCLLITCVPIYTMQCQTIEEIPWMHFSMNLFTSLPVRLFTCSYYLPVYLSILCLGIACCPSNCWQLSAYLPLPSST